VDGETVISNDGQFGDMVHETFDDMVHETFDVQVLAPSRFLVFDKSSELRRAVDDYLANNVKKTYVARKYYGWPIGIWDVSKIQDFSFLFAADGVGDGSKRFDPSAASFNEDISGWDVSSATSMRSMFNQATSFNQSIGNWDVSKVADMSNMFYSAGSFNQLLGDWEVSSVRDMSYTFSYATSFNQSFADWDVSSETDMRGIFTGANGVEVQVQVHHDD
jgi:surface protein